jgi:predicted metal-dependent hydrolase
LRRTAAVLPPTNLSDAHAHVPQGSARHPVARGQPPATPQLPLWSERDLAEAWIVRESRRCRRLTVRVFHTGRVEIVVPPHTSRMVLDRFVERHRTWIERKRAEARRNATVPQVFPPAHIELGACRETWRVHLAGGVGRARVEEGSGLLSLLGDLSSRPDVCQALRRWLIERSQLVLGSMLAHCADELGFRYERVVVRRQRTRWGSCSTRGTISLNCCLLFQRPEVVHYLLVHELSHTRHMNHSRRFWQCVALHCPDYRQLDRELLDGWRRVPSWVFSDT